VTTGPWDPRALNRRFTARCGQSGVRHMPIRDARPTCATLLVDVEVHQRVIVRIRGYADASMTLEFYSNASQSDSRRAARAGGPHRVLLLALQG